jgi:hypothetical protein
MSAIKVGDLVQVIRPGCRDAFIGRIFVVSRVGPSMTVCVGCGTTHGYPELTPLAFPVGSNRGFEFPRLKRIPPLDELERDQIVKELTA